MKQKLDSLKVISKINNLEIRLKKTINGKNDFEKVHEEVRRLCDLAFNLKRDYKSIDIDYPQIITSFRIVDGKEEIIKILAPRENQDIKWNLARKELKILGKLKSIYSLKDELKSSGEEQSIKKLVIRLEELVDKLEIKIDSINSNKC